MKTLLRFDNFLRALTFCSLFLISASSWCQTVTIGGVINIYAHVNSFDTTGCKAQLELTSAAGFSVGDSVLIIQMKGAAFDSTNSSAFGTLTNLKGAGNYEIAAIFSITSNTIMLNGKLVKPYLTTGYLQVVRIPSYVNANITSSLTCQPWNGITGGILIFSVQNNLTFNADIDVTGKGFRGGTISLNPDGFCGGFSADYYYDLNQTGATWSSGGAEKGEGIGSLSTFKRAGKGHLVNGGGGGNKQNASGGGGSNFTAGGRGGDEYVGCLAGVGAGIGGSALSSSYTNNVIFVGGGGGCGDENNGVGTAGENGGGIVIITASSITGNNYHVSANGNTVIPFAGAAADGAGGGGGGGAIFINTATITNPLTLFANGGGGGNQDAGGCDGPGGGGGTGTILTNLVALSGINYSLIPGASGTFTNGACASNWGALAGSTNTFGPITSRSLLHTPDAIPYTSTAPSRTACSGLPLSFSATATGNSYSWNGPSSYLSSSQNPTIVPSSTVNTGVYTLTATSLNGCVSIITTSATVFPTPTITVNSFTLCSGLTINITPTVTPPSSYIWNGPNGFTSSSANVSIPNATLAMSGNYNLTVTSVPGCTSSATASVGVAVVNGITVSVNSPVCTGGTLFLTSGGGSGGLSYLWNGPSMYTSSLQNSTVTPVSISSGGNYTLTASINGCSTTIVSPSVSVEVPPVISVTGASVCSGRSISIGANAPTGLTYSWSGPNSYSAPTATFTFANTSSSLTGAYSVTVTSPLGCTSSAVANLTVVNNPILSFSSDQPVCEGSTLNFTTTGGTSYVLTGPNSFTSLSANPSITNITLAASGTYSLIGTASTCTSSAFTPVTVKVKPVPVIPGLAPVCAPRPFILSVNGGATYTWSGPGGFTSTAQNPTISPSTLASAGVYSVIIQGLNGCTTTTSTAITVIITPTVTATGTTVCFGRPAVLTANGAVSYTWTGPSSYFATGPSAIIPITNNNTAGSYSLFVITPNTCTVSVLVNLGVYPLPVPVIIAPLRACVGSLINLDASGGSKYLWSGPGSFSSAIQSPSFVPSNASYNGTYSLTAFSAVGCSATTSSYIIVDPPPVAKLLGKIDGCAPLCSDYQFKPLGLSTIANTTWTTATQYSNATVFTTCFYNPGDYTIKSTITDTLGCQTLSIFNVHVRPEPKADFDYLPLKPTENIDNVVFTNTSTGDNIDTWNWYIEGDAPYVGNLQTISRIFESSGTFPVVLTVRDAYGCWDTIIKPIEVITDLNIFVPNVFTPNGDGKNENFQPKGTGIDTYQLLVFDRWGQKLFQTNVFEDGWDGTYKGTPCKTDVYTWEITATKNTGKKKILTGQVLLCR